MLPAEAARRIVAALEIEDNLLQAVNMNLGNDIEVQQGTPRLVLL